MRDNLRDRFINSSRRYQEYFKRRNLKFMEQYPTPTLNSIKEEDYDKITLVPHIWKTGDRFYKLAAEYYGDPAMWWIIAWFNYKPTESHVKIGEVIYITLSLEQTLNLLKYD